MMSELDTRDVELDIESFSDGSTPSASVEERDTFHKSKCTGCLRAFLFLDNRSQFTCMFLCGIIPSFIVIGLCLFGGIYILTQTNLREVVGILVVLLFIPLTILLYSITALYIITYRKHHSPNIGEHGYFVVFENSQNDLQ
mgnify:CR=1 FL=1